MNDQDQDLFFGLDLTKAWPDDYERRLAKLIDNLVGLLDLPVDKWRSITNKSKSRSWGIVYHKLIVVNRSIEKGQFAKAFEEFLSAIDTFINWKYPGDIYLISVWIDVQSILWETKALPDYQRQAMHNEALIALELGVKVLFDSLSGPPSSWKKHLDEVWAHLDAAIRFVSGIPPLQQR